MAKGDGRGGSRKHPADCKCGKCPKIGRRKTELAPIVTIDGRTITGQQHAQWLIDQLNAPYNPKESIELAGWRRLWDAFDKRIALETRRYLYDRAKGKATITVNHVHDRPIEHNVNLNLSERFRIAMEKAQKRVSNLR